MTRKELSKLDPMISVYRAKSTLETGLRREHPQSLFMLANHALDLIKAACLIQEARDWEKHRKRRRKIAGWSRTSTAS